jgi:hypothetical protein
MSAGLHRALAVVTHNTQSLSLSLFLDALGRSLPPSYARASYYYSVAELTSRLVWVGGGLRPDGAATDEPGRCVYGRPQGRGARHWRAAHGRPQHQAAIPARRHFEGTASTGVYWQPQRTLTFAALHRSSPRASVAPTCTYDFEMTAPSGMSWVPVGAWRTHVRVALVWADVPRSDASAAVYRNSRQWPRDLWRGWHALIRHRARDHRDWQIAWQPTDAH